MNKNCLHCQITSSALEHILDQNKNFYIVCDAHPIIRGHILLIPKKHISCVGEYSHELLSEFQLLYKKVSTFIKTTYGSVATFEHGVIGQTVFHSHTHFFPFTGTVNDIIHEGTKHLKPITDFIELKKAYEKDKKYLFFSIEERKFLVDAALGKPRFFRDRFANALGNKDRGDWKSMNKNTKLMSKASQEIALLESDWKRYMNNYH